MQHPSKSAVVVGGKDKKHQQGLTRPTKKWMVLGGAAALVLVIVVAVLHSHTAQQQSPTVYISSEQNVQKQQLAQLESHPPASSATATQKADYYQKLFVAQGDVGDYKTAVQTFKTRESITPSGLGYGDYFSLAQYYCKLQDINSARAALATEQTLLPAQDDLENGYSRTYTLMSIEQLSKDCKL